MNSDLALKLRYEERRLGARFPAYADYQRRTWRLVPFVYKPRQPVPPVATKTPA